MFKNIICNLRMCFLPAYIHFPAVLTDISDFQKQRYYPVKVNIQNDIAY